MDDTLAVTQELVAPPVHEESNDDVWGRILPIASPFPCVELVNASYSVGRQGDVQLSPLCPYFNSISKVHFEITKGNDVVSLRDKSQNGTFVNGEKVGKDKHIILNSNDEIALSCKMNKAFIFIDLNSAEQGYPPEVTRHYTISKRIGSGACGEVKLAFRNDNHDKLAVKIIEKRTFNMAAGSKNPSIQSEARILRQLNHPCIIKFIDAIDTKDKLYIFLEFVEGGELFDRVISIKQFREDDAKVLFYQMVLAIKYLHDNNVSHRDLKPENILLVAADNRTLIKVTDFGLSKFVDGRTMLKTFCGTPNYLAPEVILSSGETGYTFACDVWSLGVILFICLAGYPPFTEERTDYGLREQILSCHVDFPMEHWFCVSQSAIELIKRMLTVDPAKRISIAEVLEHPWLEDPKMRLIAKKLMYPLADVSRLCNSTDDENGTAAAAGTTAATGAGDVANGDGGLEQPSTNDKLSNEPLVKRKKL